MICASSSYVSRNLSVLYGHITPGLLFLWPCSIYAVHPLVGSAETDVESLDVNARIARPFVAVRVWVIKLMIEHEMAAIQRFTRVQFQKQMTSVYYSAMLISKMIPQLLIVQELFASCIYISIDCNAISGSKKHTVDGSSATGRRA